MQSLFPHQPWPVIPTPDRRKILTRRDASAPYTSQDTPQPIMRYNPSLLCTDTAQSQVSTPCDDGATVGVTFSDPASQSSPCLHASMPGHLLHRFASTQQLPLARFSSHSARRCVYRRCIRRAYSRASIFLNSCNYGHRLRATYTIYLPDFERETSHPHRQQEGFLS